MDGNERLDFDLVNRPAYGGEQAVREFVTASGWLDPGERTAVEFPLALGGAGPVLDIGYGGGRTVPLMRGLYQGYTGIDYTPELVRAAQKRFPDVDLRQMDARKLDFPDGSFGLASFSFNGIDSVDEEGRLAIFREVHRVLRPRGFFVFSALNHHSLRDRAPLRLPDRPSVRHPRALLRWILSLPVSYLNARRLNRWRVEDTDSSVRTVPALHCALIARYISVPAQVRQSAEQGFETLAIYDHLGKPTDPDDIAPTADYLHYVTRKTT